MYLPVYIDSVAMFGLTLLLGLIGGEIAKRSYVFPVISGYIAMGFIIGPNGFNIINSSMLASSRIFIEISLSLVLFDMGRHLDFRWLYRDSGLLLTSFVESGLTFLIIFLLSYYVVGFSWLQSAFAGAIAMATSPAVVMMVANDLSSEGPVTRRALILTSMNNFLALVVFTFLLPLTQVEVISDSLRLLHASYRLFGSFSLGIVMFVITQAIAHFIGKHRENQFILFVGIVMLTMSVCYMLKLSTMMSLFSLGVASRNLDYKHRLMQIDFGWLGRLFFVLLFVVTGIHLQIRELWGVGVIVLLFIVARGIAKTAGIFLFSRMSNLTNKQAIALSFALTPMAGVAIGMSNTLVDYSPNLGNSLVLLVTGVVAVLNLFGPIATQLAFIKTGEALAIQSHEGDIK